MLLSYHRSRLLQILLRPSRFYALPIINHTPRPPPPNCSDNLGFSSDFLCRSNGNLGRRSLCSAGKGEADSGLWTEDIEYLDESGSVIYAGKGVRSVEPGVDDHVLVGDFKKPFMNASAVAKLVEIVNRWRWGPELESHLDKLQFVPNMVHVLQALKVVGDADASVSLFKWAKRQPWYSRSDECYTVLFDRLNGSRDFEGIQSLFDEMVADSSKAGVSSFTAYNRVIQHLAKAEKLEVSFCCFKKVQDSGGKLETQTYNDLITLFLLKGLPYKAFEIYENMVAAECSLEGSTYEMLIPKRVYFSSDVSLLDNF